MKRLAYIEPGLVAHSVRTAIEQLAAVVGATLGPAGRPILIEGDGGRVLVTKDGVTVAKQFQSADSIQNAVATAAREACERTVNQAGDGTTTAIVLARALVRAGQDFLETRPQYSPQRLARELKALVDQDVRPKLMALSKQIRDLKPEDTKQAVLHVAKVSANHDLELAAAVAEGVDYVGEDGMVIAEEGIGHQTTVERQEGYPINAGLHDLGGAASAAFINRTSHGDCMLDGAYLAFYDGEINDVETVAPLLTRVVGEMDDRGIQRKHPIVIFAHGFSTQVLKALAENFRRGVVSAVPFVTPRNGQASGKQAFLYDLAAYAGGEVFDPQAKFLQDAIPAQLGFVNRIRVGQNETVILAEPELEKVEQRIADLKLQMESASEFDCDRIRYRIGQLTGGVATVYAGGATAVEAKERHARAVDAISAVRSAIMMGVIPGGGSALAVLSRYYRAAGEDDPKRILGNALWQPFAQILLNAGYAKSHEEALVMSEKLGGEGDDFAVFDALNGAYAPWYASGIMDPVKVTLSALDNALSVAQLLMTLGGVMVAEISEGEAQAMAMQDAVLKAVNEGAG